MQDNGRSKNEKLREFYRGSVEAFGWLFWNSYRIAVATLVVFSCAILAGLMTADPDTATFRDLLMAVRNPSIWCSSAVIAFLWIGVKLILFPRRPYPIAAAAFAQGKASSSRSVEPK